MPAQADEAASNIIARAAAGAEQTIRLNIQLLLVLLDSLAEALPFSKRPLARCGAGAARSGHLRRAGSFAR